MTELIIIKTAALGDVLRTTSVLPGLAARFGKSLSVTWITAPSARDLLVHHPLVDELVTVEAGDASSRESVRLHLRDRRFDWLLSFDDEMGLCRLAAGIDAERRSGAFLRDDGSRAYTDDVAPWFDMGLLSRQGKERADELKVANTRTHPEIFASMLGVEVGHPELVLGADAERFGAAFAEEHGLGDSGPVIGLNTGSGGRWPSKQIDPERTVALAERLHDELEGDCTFVLFGGPEERERNGDIARRFEASGGDLRLVDAGCDNPLLEFAALVDRCDHLVTSDSLAMHVAIARRVGVTAFFAPTSAAEIELYGRGEKVASTAADYCSYRPDADNASVTAERLAEAALRTLRAGVGTRSR